MKAGFKFKNEFGVNMVLDHTRPFKVLGSFTTRSDSAQTFIQDDRIVGKDIAIIPVDIKLVAAGTNNMYMFPSKLSVAGNQIKWKYQKLHIDLLTGWFHGIKDGVKGTDPVYEVTFIYGWYNVK